MVKKRGDISASFLITVILGVLAFGIVLIVYSQFSWTASADRETCHQSVIFRATLPSIAGAKEFVPLKCKTEKICFTSGIIGGKCSEFENTLGITKTKVSKKEQIEQAIAKEMVDCWEMMGQAKLSLFSNWFAETYGFQDVASSCVICSRLAFDKESLAKAGIDMREVDVMNYIMKHLIPGRNITYYDYLGGNKGKISIKDENVENLIKEITAKIPAAQNNQNVQASNPSLSTDQKPEQFAIMFMQVYAPKYGDVFKNSLLSVGALGVFLAASPAGKVSSKVVQLACSGAPIVCAVLGVVGVTATAGYQTYSVFNNNAIAAGYCGDIAVGDKAETGCSVVRVVNYGVEDLSKYCSTIESIS